MFNPIVLSLQSKLFFVFFEKNCRRVGHHTRLCHCWWKDKTGANFLSSLRTLSEGVVTNLWDWPMRVWVIFVWHYKLYILRLIFLTAKKKKSRAQASFLGHWQADKVDFAQYGTRDTHACDPCCNGRIWAMSAGFSRGVQRVFPQPGRISGGHPTHTSAN